MYVLQRCWAAGVIECDECPLFLAQNVHPLVVLLYVVAKILLLLHMHPLKNTLDWRKNA